MSEVTLNKMNTDMQNVQHQNVNSYQKTNDSIGTAQESTPKTKDVQKLNPKEIKQTVKKLNENISRFDKGIKFSYNDTIKSLTVQVIDEKSGKIIREIPPKEVINLQKRLSEVVGVIFDSKEVQ